MNVAVAPEVPTEGPEHGRPSTCLLSHLPPPSPPDLVQALAESIRDSLSRPLPPASAVVSAFESRAELNRPLRMRREGGGGEVTPLRVEPDGQLVVRVEETGEVKTLNSDYLF